MDVGICGGGHYILQTCLLNASTDSEGKTAYGGRLWRVQYNNYYIPTPGSRIITIPHLFQMVDKSVQEFLIIREHRESRLGNPRSSKGISIWIT